jgi:glycerol kinase
MHTILALDQGTTSSRAILFDREGQVVRIAQQEYPQHFPQPGWVEHDPLDIWTSQLACARQVLAEGAVDAAQVAAIGITNQRETTVVWDRRTGEPLCHAIVWQDRRTAELCDDLRAAGKAPLIQRKTGLELDAYFSATKLQWLLTHVPGARERAERGELAFGTVDSWLVYKLTGRHVTDPSNAARTMLFNINSLRWDPELLSLFGVPASMLPEVVPSSGIVAQSDPAWFGRAIPIAGIAGDQQAATFGQACHQRGMVKNTYGTGCFMLMHTGDRFQTSGNGLVTTSAAQTDARPVFALEGSVFVGGAVVQWLRDGLRAFVHSSDVEALARSVPDSGGVLFVPAFTGLGAPWWDPQARGTITGLTRGTTMAHVARAALESIAYQSAALLQAMSRDAQSAGAAPLTALRVDGGACVNDLLMQFQSDLLGIPVLRPTMVETTALGAAFLAGLHAGVYAGTQELESLWRIERQFDPLMPRDEAARRLAEWDHAVRQACAR